MVEINWTPQSLYDINNIAEFIAKDSERYAKIQTERFFKARYVPYMNLYVSSKTYLETKKDS